jgi:hypothetical protein
MFVMPGLVPGIRVLAAMTRRDTFAIAPLVV